MLCFHSVDGRKLLFLLILMHILNAIFLSCFNFLFSSCSESHCTNPLHNVNLFTYVCDRLVCCVILLHNPTPHRVYLQTFWAEDLSENIVVRKRSFLSHAGHLTVPCYSLGHCHWLVHSLDTLTPHSNTSSAIYTRNTYAAKYLPFNTWLTRTSVLRWLVWILLLIYCRKLTHRCTVTSYSSHQLYWLWLTQTTNKQVTTVSQCSHLKLSHVMGLFYEWFVLF